MSPSRSPIPRLLIAIGALVAAGLIGYFVAASVTHVDVSRLKPATPPKASTPAPQPTPLADLGRAALASVVTVETERTTEEALGTGWLLDSHGDFVTNAHVVEGQLSVRITDRHDKTHVGVVVGMDTNQDIAVVRSSDGFGGTPLPVDSTPISTVPQDVIALASSRATGQSDMTQERLVLLHQDVPLQNGEVQPGTSAPPVYHDMLNLSGARVYQGNSGGPLLDGKGRVIGIITLASPSGDEAFAIPLSRVLAELQQFAAKPG